MLLFNLNLTFWLLTMIIIIPTFTVEFQIRQKRTLEENNNNNNNAPTQTKNDRNHQNIILQNLETVQIGGEKKDKMGETAEVKRQGEKSMEKQNTEKAIWSPIRGPQYAPMEKEGTAESIEFPRNIYWNSSKNVGNLKHHSELENGQNFPKLERLNLPDLNATPEKSIYTVRQPPGVLRHLRSVDHNILQNVVRGSIIELAPVKSASLKEYNYKVNSAVIRKLFSTDSEKTESENVIKLAVNSEEENSSTKSDAKSPNKTNSMRGKKRKRYTENDKKNGKRLNLVYLLIELTLFPIPEVDHEIFYRKGLLDKFIAGEGIYRIGCALIGFRKELTSNAIQYIITGLRQFDDRLEEIGRMCAKIENEMAQKLEILNGLNQKKEENIAIKVRNLDFYARFYRELRMYLGTMAEAVEKGNIHLQSIWQKAIRFLTEAELGLTQQIKSAEATQSVATMSKKFCRN